MIILDTNVISETRRINTGRSNPHVEDWLRRQDADDLYLSVITISELEVGVLSMLRRDVQQGTILRNWLDQKVLVEFQDRILPLGLEAARLAASMQVPDHKEANDAYIAATALACRCPVATRNVKHFLSMGVQVINPWE